MYPERTGQSGGHAHLTLHLTDKAVSQAKKVLNYHPTAQSLPLKVCATPAFQDETLCPH